MSLTTFRCEHCECDITGGVRRVIAQEHQDLVAAIAQLPPGPQHSAGQPTVYLADVLKLVATVADPGGDPQ